MRSVSLLGVLVLISFMTAMMGLPLPGAGGKFSPSNIAPILFVAIGAVLYLRKEGSIHKNILWFFLLFNLSCFLSFVIFLLRFDWRPNFLVLLFQDIELVFCFLLIWYGRQNFAEFRSLVRPGIVISAAIGCFYGWLDFREGNLLIAFGMDDKSHAAVLLACYSYIFVRFFPGGANVLIGLALLGISFLTISRLPVFFAPAIALAIVQGSRFGAALGAVGIGAFALTAIVVGEVVSQVFRVFARLSSFEAIVGEASTSAHLLLLATALKMKFSDLWSFVFGIGPGNFSKALLTNPDAFAQFERIDPNISAAARLDKAPLHSTAMQLLLDYNILLFFCFLFYITRTIGQLMRSRSLPDLAFAAGVVMASMFYSIHNKPYFFLVLTTVGLLLLGERNAALASGVRKDSKRVVSMPGKVQPQVQD
jgi:hypothetical protein